MTDVATPPAVDTGAAALLHGTESQAAAAPALTLSRRLAGNTLWNGLRFFTTGLGGLVISSLIARLLGPRGMGHYSYLLWWAGTAATLAQAGLLETTTRFVARAIGAGDWNGVGGVVRCTLRLQAVIAAVTLSLVLLGFTLCGHLSRGSWLDLGMVVALALPFTFSRVYMAALTASERYRSLALCAMAVTIAQAAALLALGRQGTGPRQLLCLAALAELYNLAAAVMVYHRMIREQSVVPGLSPPHRRELRSFALDMVWVIWLNAIVWQRSEILLLKLWSTPEQIAFYTVAYDIGAKFSGIPAILSSQCWVLFPSLLGAGLLAELRRQYAGMARTLTLVALPLFFGGGALAPLFVPLLYSSAYRGAVAPTQILLAGNVAGIVSHVAMAYLAASGHQRAAVRLTAVMAGVNIGLGCLLVPRWGALGAACSNSITQFLAATAYVAWIQRRGAPFPWRTLAAVVVAAALLWVVCWKLCSMTGGLLGGALGAVGGLTTYLVFCTLTGVLRLPIAAGRQQSRAAAQTTLPPGLLPAALFRRAMLVVANPISGVLPSTRCFGLRRALYRLAGLELGPNVSIVGGVRCLTHGISIGENSWVNTDTLLSAGGEARIRIGRNVDLGPRCSLITGTHAIGGPDRRAGIGYGRDIEVGDGTWLGANVTVIAGVTIGPGCVVGAGSVVIRDIPPHVLAAGNPARVIRPLPREEEDATRDEVGE